MAKSQKKKYETRGRPSLFNERVSNKIIELCKAGKTNEQIADIIGIHVGTLYLWMSQRPEFLEALKEAKQAADELVEASLFRRAMGYNHEATKILAYEGSSWEHKYVEHYPPDTTAAIFWLKNRQPEKWRDKQELEHTGKDGEPLPPTQIILNIPDNGRGKKD